MACRCLDLRLLSWRERCSDLLNARLQNWHLYLFSFSFSLSGGAVPLEALRLATGDAPGVISAPATADMLRTTPALAADGSAGDFWGGRKGATGDNQQCEAIKWFRCCVWAFVAWQCQAA